MGSSSPSAGYQVYGTDGMYGPDYLGSVVRSTASECGLASALSPLSLSTCAGAMSKLGEMSSACGDNGDDDDDDKNNPRTPATCASAACLCFIASVTDDALQDMLTGFAACTGPLAGYQVYGTDGMYGPDYLGSVVRSTASECGLASAPSPVVVWR